MTAPATLGEHISRNASVVRSDGKIIIRTPDARERTRTDPGHTFTHATVYFQPLDGHYYAHLAESEPEARGNAGAFASRGNQAAVLPIVTHQPPRRTRKSQRQRFIDVPLPITFTEQDSQP